MIKEFKPTNYNSVSPYLMVKGAEKMIKLLSKLFGAKVKRKFDKPDGSIMHVEVQIDDSIIMMSEATDQYPATHYWMHVYVPDVDSIFSKAIEMGCELIEKPKTQENDPDKRGTFKDFAGNMWSVATQTTE